MRNITAEIRDEIEKGCKKLNLRKTKLAERAHMDYATFKAFMSCRTKTIKLEQAQKLLDEVGLELLIFEKDEQFNDKYDNQS